MEHVSPLVSGAKYLLSSAIALEFPSIAVGIMEEAIRRNAWESVAGGIANALGDNPVLSSRFVLSPEGVKEQMIQTMVPYALQMLEHGKEVDVAYLLASAIDLGFSDIAKRIMDELATRGAWRALLLGVNRAFSATPLFPHFTSLQQAKQKELLRMVSPHMLRSLKSLDSDDARLAREPFGFLISSGFLKTVLSMADELTKRELWLTLSEGIARAFATDWGLFERFASLPRFKQKELLQVLSPYALRASGHKQGGGAMYLLATAIALGFPGIAKEVAEKLTEQKSWGEISGGIAEAFGMSDTLFERLASLPRSQQKWFLEVLFPLALRASLHHWEEGTVYLLASAIVLDFSDIAVEMAEKLAEQGEWCEISGGILSAFSQSSSLHRYFAELSKETQLILWRLLLPYAIRAHTKGWYGGLNALLVFHNPVWATYREWIALYGRFVHISDRAEFLKAIARPRLSHLSEPWQFTPEEYACLVARYVQEKGDITQPLLKAVRRAVEENPELIGGIVQLSHEYPAELLPVVQKIVPSQGGISL